jgi:hypothetical protein
VKGVDISEDCRCRAAIRIRGLGSEAALAAVTSWRQNHHCVAPGQSDASDAAMTHGGECSIIGFTATREAPYFGNGIHEVEAR